MKVAVVGGGIAGLAAAWELRADAEVTVFEPAALGGKVRTSVFEGVAVDEGPDAFLTRSPAAVQLCSELGLDSELVAPAAGRTLLWAGGRLKPLPDGLVLGVPGRLAPVVRSGLLSPAGMARAGLDLVLPGTPAGDDVGVGELVTARLGREVADRLVEPLLGSIHAAPITGMSAAATAPQLLAAARRRRSLFRALREGDGSGGGRPPPGDGGPLFLAPRLGMGRIVQRLHEELHAAGVRVERFAVETVRVTPAGVEMGGSGIFDAAVLAVPAPVASRLLGAAAPPPLAAIELTSVSLVTLAYDAARMEVPAAVNGVLVPAGEGRLMTACSFGSNKWPQWATPGRVVVRVSVGRRGDTRADELDDGALVDRLSAELAAALGSRAAPLAARVSRWPEAFPFFRVGHPELVTGIRDDLRLRAPAVALAGASYGGAGIPACIASGRAAAAAVRERRLAARG